MTKYIYISLFFLHFASLSHSQIDSLSNNFIFSFTIDRNFPLENCSYCLKNEKIIGLGDLSKFTYAKSNSYQLSIGIKTRRMNHFIGLILLSTKFSFDTTSVFFNYQYYNNTAPLNQYKYQINSDTKYVGIKYSLQMPISFKSLTGFYLESGFFIGYNPASTYNKIHFDYVSGVRTEIFPYYKFSYGINLSLGYSYEIWKGIQFSVHTGVSYRIIAMYYNFGLSLGYKFNLPKKKEEN